MKIKSQDASRVFLSHCLMKNEAKFLLILFFNFRMFRRFVQRIAPVKKAKSVTQHRSLMTVMKTTTPRGQVNRLGLILSAGGILNWLNIKKDEKLPESSVTTIDPDSQLVQTIQLAAQSINVTITYCY